jgi:hypothetical protein
LDDDALDTALGQWATARTEAPAGTRVDSRSSTEEARHLLAAIDHRAGVMIGQVEVAG